MFNHGIGVRFIQHVLKSYGVHQLRRLVVRAVPRRARRRLHADLRRRCRLARAHRHREHRLPGADRLAPGREHAQLAGAGVRQAVERKVPIIVVDPRYSVAASKAKYWLPIKPGTDLALLLAWMNVLVTEGRYDKDLRRAVRPRLRQVRRRDQGLHARVGRRARPASRPALIRADRARVRQPPAGHADPPGPPRQLVRRRHAAQPRDRAAQRAAGQLGPQGRHVHPHGIKIAPYPLPKYPESDKPRGRQPERRAVSVRRRRHHHQHPRSHDHGKPYPIKGWFVYSTNLIQALPNRAETIKAIEQLDLLVVCDTVPSEIAGYADVILPDTTFLERHDELLTGWGRTRLGLAAAAGGRAAARPEARLVDRQATGRQARRGRVHALQGHGGVPGRRASRSPATTGKSSRRKA
jgi:thiosulfate reductase / polysulfide reductase chain A